MRTATNRKVEGMVGDDQAVKVYEGEPDDVLVLRSLLESAGIEIVTAEAFFGPAREIYVRGCDVADARAIIEDAAAQSPGRMGEVLRGPWPTDQ